MPLALDVRLGIGICSYDGMLSFGITGDGDDASGIETLARGLTHTLEELLQRSVTATHPDRAPNSAVVSTHHEARPPPWPDKSVERSWQELIFPSSPGEGIEPQRFKRKCTSSPPDWSLAMLAARKVRSTERT